MRIKAANNGRPHTPAPIHTHATPPPPALDETGEELKLKDLVSNKRVNVGNRCNTERYSREEKLLFSKNDGLPLCVGAYRACAVPAAICPAFVLPVDDPLDAAGSLTIAAFQPIHLLLRPGQLLKKNLN